MDRLFGIDISKRPRRRTESDTSSEEETRRQLHPYDALRRSRGRQSSSQNLQPDRQMRYGSAAVTAQQLRQSNDVQ